MVVKDRATVADLYRVEGKAELVNGEIKTYMPTGGKPANAGFEVTWSLKQYLRRSGLPGFAVPDGAGFLVDLPNRQSFSPDASYFIGDEPSMRFYDGAPIFAVEIRSENDYGPAMEIILREKREDYFAAGTQVVWDVDLLGDDIIIRKYTISDAAQPTVVFRRGETAEAEPAVPGWTMPVDNLFLT
jgi:Uma2 family endonuclease